MHRASVAHAQTARLKQTSNVQRHTSYWSRTPPTIPHRYTLTPPHTHKLGHNVLLAKARGVDISKANTRQQAKRNLMTITIVKVLHKVLYLRRTEMNSKKEKRKVNSFKVRHIVEKKKHSQCV